VGSAAVAAFPVLAVLVVFAALTAFTVLTPLTAVAAFGQKLRGDTRLGDLDYADIREDGLTVLLGESDFTLTLSVLNQGEEQRYPGGFHVGFNLKSEVELRAAHARLVSSDVQIVRPLGELGGALTFHCVAPGALLVELAWRPQ